MEYHAFPLRSHWLGGGYPTLGDPEDPTLNPFVLLTIFFGTVMGLKIIVYLALLVGGLSAYALTRYVFGYTRWGALFSGLMFGTSLFVPLRILDGNPNEVYAAFLPLCMLLVGLACRRRKIAFLILPFVLYTMLSDGKLTALMAIFYMGLFCLMDMAPVFNTFTGRDVCATKQKKVYVRPVKVLALALFVTFLIGMVRFLPALELIQSKGGLGHIDLFFYPDEYTTQKIYAYKFQELWQWAITWKGQEGLVTVGWVPVALSAVALFAYWKRSLPWAICLVLFVWLTMAHNARVDLFRLLWKLPIFNAVNRPYKYFTFQIAFTLAIASGQSFWLLRKLRYRWLEHLCAIILIIAGMWFLYPRMARIQRDTYKFETPAEFLAPEEEFYNIQGQNLKRNREEQLRSVTYFNVIRNVGTVDWYTGIPIAEDAAPKYFIDEQDNHIPNPEYRGEVYSPDIEDMETRSEFQPNSISVQLDIKTPGTVVVNQNYHRDWHTDKGELFNKDGLLGLRFQEAGSYTIRMKYIPRSFYGGLMVSIFSLFALAFVCWAYKTGRLLRWSQSATPFLRRGSQALLWLVD
ncbi:hypothetical protein ACFL6S_25045 [Candidatus Poribacteria bacterium]